METQTENRLHFEILLVRLPPCNKKCFSFGDLFTIINYFLRITKDQRKNAAAFPRAIVTRPSVKSKSVASCSGYEIGARLPDRPAPLNRQEAQVDRPVSVCQSTWRRRSIDLRYFILQFTISKGAS